MLPFLRGTAVRTHPGRSCHPTGPGLSFCFGSARTGKGRAASALNKPEKQPSSALLPSPRRRGGSTPAGARGVSPSPVPRPARPAARGLPRRARGGRSVSSPGGRSGLCTPTCVRPTSRVSAVLCLPMEGAGSPSTGEELELSVLGGQPDEQKPLNGTVHVIPLSAEESRAAQANKENPWSSCNKKLIGKCRLWMVIASVFLGLIVVIIISLCLIGATYIDEDENEILELSSNKTFLVELKIPEDCVTEEELPHQLRKRLTDVYSSSPSLSRYFTSVEVMDFSENATVAYHLQFGVPSEDDSFMKYMMSKELVLGILLQDLHDQRVSGCETLGLDPASLLLYE
ncbi:TPA-induced transmembrane protein isoform X2 [Panthera pardus]|uniref:TPA-induced transmembrane protein isoform X2 n=1 Tax=Panthera pardus TaxID=9691 RepID=A0A9V1FJ58_PANPR|nr:TPA-induced transmembrane protein isoform X2 [Panthera pardus]